MRIKLQTPFVSFDEGDLLIAVGQPRGQGFTVNGGDQLKALLERILPDSDQATRSAATARVAQFGGASEILADNNKGALRVFTRDGPVTVVESGSVTVGSGIGQGEALNLVGTVPGDLVDPLVRSLAEGDSAGRARARDLEASLASVANAFGKREFAVADDLIGTYVMLAEVAGARGDAKAMAVIADKVGQLVPRVQMDLVHQKSVAVADRDNAARLAVQEDARSAQRIAVKARVVDQLTASFAAAAMIPSNRDAVIKLEAKIHEVEHAVGVASAADAATSASSHGVRAAEPVMMSTGA